MHVGHKQFASPAGLQVPRMLLGKNGKILRYRAMVLYF
jgi:hypothetical protein